MEWDNDRSHGDESKDWDDDECEDSKETLNSTEGDDSSLLCDDDNNNSTNNNNCSLSAKPIACLSSMCHTRNNVNCQASFPTSSPSSCVCNCSCRTTAALTLSPAPSSSQSSLSSLSSLLSQPSSSTQSLLSSPGVSYSIVASSSQASGNSPLPSSSSACFESSTSTSPVPLVSGIVQNVRQCIPSGNIRPLSKSLRRPRNPSKAVCNISFRDTNFVINQGDGANSSISSQGALKCAINGQISSNTEPKERFVTRQSVFSNPQMVTGAENKSPNASPISDLTTKSFSTVTAASKDTFLSPPCGQSRISRSGCHAVLPSNGADGFISATPETSGKILSGAACLNFEQFSNPIGDTKSQGQRNTSNRDRVLSPRRSSKRVKLEYTKSDNLGSSSNTQESLVSSKCDNDDSQCKPQMNDNLGSIVLTRKRKCSTSSSL